MNREDYWPEVTTYEADGNRVLRKVYHSKSGHGVITHTIAAASTPEHAKLIAELLTKHFSL